MWPFSAQPKSEDLDKRRLEAFGVIAVVSSLCSGPERLPVLHGVRESLHNVSDSGWILASVRESRQFADDAKNYKLVPLEMRIEADRTLAPMRDWPVGSEVTRRGVAEPWRYIVNDRVVDDDGKIVGETRHAT